MNIITYIPPVININNYDRWTFFAIFKGKEMIFTDKKMPNRDMKHLMMDDAIPHIVTAMEVLEHESNYFQPAIDKLKEALNSFYPEYTAILDELDADAERADLYGRVG